MVPQLRCSPGRADSGGGDGVFDRDGDSSKRTNRTAGSSVPVVPTFEIITSVASSALGDGDYVITGPTYTGQRCGMGRAAVIDTGAARILVSEQPHEPWDLAVFTSLGLDPAGARVLILKSRMYCRPVFEPIARAVVECASRGVTSSDYALFPFRKLARPAFPLDPDAAWTP